MVHPSPQARLTAAERAAYASNMPCADLSSGVHGTRQSATYLLEDTARGHRQPVIVSAIDSAKLAAPTSAVEVLKEAIPCATLCMCLYGVGAILLRETSNNGRLALEFWTAAVHVAVKSWILTLWQMPP